MNMSHPDGKQTVLLVFRHSQQYRTDVPAIRLLALDPKAVYRLESVDGKLVNKAGMSGTYLMSRGLNVSLRGDYDSTAVILEWIQ